MNWYWWPTVTDWPTLWVKITSKKIWREWAFPSQLSLTAHGMHVWYGTDRQRHTGRHIHGQTGFKTMPCLVTTPEHRVITIIIIIYIFILLLVFGEQRWIYSQNFIQSNYRWDFQSKIKTKTKTRVNKIYTIYLIQPKSSLTIVSTFITVSICHRLLGACLQTHQSTVPLIHILHPFTTN